MAFGAILMLSSLFADQLALGMPGSGFGWKQVTGTLVGIVITAGGAYLLHRVPAEDDEEERHEQEGDRL